MAKDDDKFDPNRTEPSLKDGKIGLVPKRSNKQTLKLVRTAKWVMKRDDGYNPWDILPGETADEYERFRAFLELETGKRSKKGAFNSWRTRQTPPVQDENTTEMGRFRTLFGKRFWLKRARAFDNHLGEVFRLKAEKIEKSNAIVWAERREEIRERAFDKAEGLFEMVEKMRGRVMEMMKTDVIPAKVKETDISGTARALASVMEIADKLARLSSEMETGLVGVKYHEVDVTKLTVEQLERINNGEPIEKVVGE